MGDAVYPSPMCTHIADCAPAMCTCITKTPCTCHGYPLMLCPSLSCASHMGHVFSPSYGTLSLSPVYTAHTQAHTGKDALPCGTESSKKVPARIQQSLLAWPSATTPTSLLWTFLARPLQKGKGRKAWLGKGGGSGCGTMIQE